MSGMYRLECGVRQAGLTSPSLFKQYMNRLIVELSNTGIGCSIEGTIVNNISYTDDMVLLNLSISALRKLVKNCELYAVAQVLRYNATSKASCSYLKLVANAITPFQKLNKVTKLKYLGHWVTESFGDNTNIEREHRALAVRGNMLARRFARCTSNVKVSIFKAYCKTFYTSSLWVNYNLKALSSLRVVFNNIFRMLLRLPRFRSASGMFAYAQIDGFAAIIRKRIASLKRRISGSGSGLLSIIAGRVEGSFLEHWIKIHTHPKQRQYL
ncbi:uncharacterized protein LOC113229316 [Hyposmocoma kahamanoa]|uniref:uncharacterized protein LOC113229316 n=1 Tax=Hyposmocoma kahamanoa TaxID=1477025 RepID=UPI000E6D9BAA|nr:uncharacterized protein LOC113229316 [Hyposmocoma kahamanoa]